MRDRIIQIFSSNRAAQLVKLCDNIMLYDFFHANRSKSRTYFGFDIYKSGGWWYCEFGMSTEQWLQADTLAGIKLALRRKLKALWPETYGHLNTESPLY